MASVPPSGPLPANLLPLPRLLAYTQARGLERHLARPTRGISTLAPALVWLIPARRGTGRPHRRGLLDGPPAAPLGRARPPPAQTLHRSLDRSAAKPMWAAVEAARFQRGWSGTHSRRRPRRGIACTWRSTPPPAR